VRILIVDDSLAMRKLITRTIKAAELGEVELVEAPSGESALQQLAEMPSPPVLMITDWNMDPGINGLELVEEVNRRGYSFPIGFITTENTGPYRERLEAAGVAFHLGKPFNPEDAKAALRKALNQDAAATQAAAS
jgi:two-component system, chemotaxis family, chemotaxis protein CheY